MVEIESLLRFSTSALLEIWALFHRFNSRLLFTMGDENDAANYVYDQFQVYLCPSWALSLGYMGVAAGACLSNWGSAVSFFST